MRDMDMLVYNFVYIEENYVDSREWGIENNRSLK